MDWRLTRRQVLGLGALALTSRYRASAMDNLPQDGLETILQAAHRELWKRFIDPHYYILYDYAGLNGEVVLPTTQDCLEDKPNALAWWAPIENGAFFGGLYLDGLCRHWQHSHDPQTANEAKKIVAGLTRLATVGRAPGFVARGVAADGQSHYVMGSDDQTLPWFYGLWRYWKSSIPGEAERAAVQKLLLEVGTALEKNRWQMPCDRAGLGPRGSWTSPNFVHAPRLLFVIRALYDITDDKHWLELYQTKLRETLPKSAQNRLEICAGGALYEPYSANYKPSYPENPEFWTTASTQAVLRALVELETDAKIRDEFQKGLDLNARAALNHVSRAQKYDAQSPLVFDVDWRFLNQWWEPQHSTEDAVNVALIQVREWDKRSPRRGYEYLTMREPLFAAWVVVMSGNRELITAAKPTIEAALRHYDWSKLYISLFFIAENIGYELEALA